MTTDNIHDLVLGLILKEPRNLDDAITLGLTADHFEGWHKDVYVKATEMKEAGIEPNFMNLCMALPQSVTNLCNVIDVSPVGVNFSWYCNQLTTVSALKKKALDLQAIAVSMMKMTYTESVEPVVNLVHKALSEIQELQRSDSKATRFTGQLLDDTLTRIETRINDFKDGKLRGILTGIPKLDENTTGFVGGRFYILAARTSVGKTTFANFLAMSALSQGKQVLIFSNEMDAEDLVEKFISKMTGIDSKRIQTGDLPDSSLARICDKINDFAKYKIGINQHYGWRLETLESEIFKQHRAGKCDIVFIDYTQQVKFNAKNKHEQVSEVSDRLKRISRELNIPVIGLAQINRETEKGGVSVMPGLAQLKDSGSLEQDADVVMILHKEKISDENVVLNLAKNRHGKTGIINLVHHITVHDYSQMPG